MTDERKRYIDYFKALAMILVILGHINSANEAIKPWIYAFHMPAFFFASGLVVKQKPLNIKFIEGKFRALMVPYLIWGLMYSGYSVGNVKKLLYASRKCLSQADSLTSLWFLPALFLALLLVQVVLKIAKNKPLEIIIALALYVVSVNLPARELGYPWCADAAVMAACFILLGHVSISAMDKMNWWQSILTALVGLAGTMTYSLNPVAEKQTMMMAQMRIGDPVWCFIAALSGCLLVAGIANLLDCVLNDERPLSFIGENTLVIFLVHKPVIWLCEKHVTPILPENAWVQLAAVCVIVTVVSGVLALAIGRFAPTLAGRTKSE